MRLEAQAARALGPPAPARALGPALRTALAAALVLACAPCAALAGPAPAPDQIAAWMKTLPPARSPERAAAVAGMLREVPELEAVLLEILGGEDPEVAARAARILGELGSGEAVAPLTRILFDPPLPREEEAAGPSRGGSTVRGYDARALGQVHALRMEAAGALGRIAGETALEALARIAQDGDVFSARLLGSSAVFDASSGRLLSAAETRRYPEELLGHASRVLAAADAVVATEAFARALKSQETLIRDNAIHGLARSARNPAARELLLPLLLDEALPVELLRQALEIVARETPYAEMRSVAEEFLADRRCSAREQGLSILLAATAENAAREALAADGGLAATLAEQLRAPCYGVAARASLLVHRLGEDGRLLRALRERDLAAVAEHFVFFVMLGEEGSEPTLAEALERDGTADMCNVFLLSGNAELMRAGAGWQAENPKEEPGFERGARGELLYWGALAAEGEP